jgi:hypothetical protein
VGENKYTLSNKKAGKSILTGTIELSTDGKLRTLVTQSIGADGKKKPITFVYEKQ